MIDSNHDVVPTLRLMDGLMTNKAADEIERLRAEVAALKRITPVHFMGVDPLSIGKGATLPMIPDSWRFGFYKSGDELRFGFQDNGPLVAYAAVEPTAPDNPEDYLRGQYGAYRGHPAWRELERAFKAGRDSASPLLPQQGGQTTIHVDALAQEIRRVDGNHSMGAGALAEALLPFLGAAVLPQVGERPKFELTEEMRTALDAANNAGKAYAILPDGALMTINRGEQPEDTSDLDCPHCHGSGHKDDVKVASLSDSSEFGLQVGETKAVAPSARFEDRFFEIASPGIPANEMNAAMEWFMLGAREFYVTPVAETLPVAAEFNIEKTDSPVAEWRIEHKPSRFIVHVSASTDPYEQMLTYFARAMQGEKA